MPGMERGAASVTVTLQEEKARIVRAVESAAGREAPYGVWLPFLQALFLAQADARHTLSLTLPPVTAERVRLQWESGFPLLRRWEFPLDAGAAEKLLAAIEAQLPQDNEALGRAARVLRTALEAGPQRREGLWQFFLQPEREVWPAGLESEEGDAAPLLFLGRAVLRPALQWTAEQLLARFPLPAGWLHGYCPICGSLPALLFLNRAGERRAHCSWCAAVWGLHRFQCPSCDNRLHDSLGYFAVEDMPHYRVQYCNLCRNYFKSIDTRELLEDPYLPLEEWTTIHLDLLAQHQGLIQPPSPAPIVYGGREALARPVRTLMA